MSNDQASRRSFVQQASCGFGSLAMTAMGASGIQAAQLDHRIAPKAKRIIFLFMQGGVSQVDSFDHKPSLAKYHEQEMTFDDARTIAKQGKRATKHKLMKSPWEFRRYGQSGKLVSDLFPESAAHVDDLCFLHGLHTEGVAHGPSTLFLHCGASNFVRPSIGSWVYYGLGTENEDLPGFVSISPSIGNGGARNYGTAFLPARYQGTPIGTAGKQSLKVENLERPAGVQPIGETQRDLIRKLNRAQLDRRRDAGQLAAVDQSYDLAWRMQRVAPDLMDLVQGVESDANGVRFGQSENARLRNEVLARAKAMRGRRAFHPGHLRRQFRESFVGSAFEHSKACSACGGGGSTDRSATRRLETAWASGRHDRLVGQRVWTNALRAKQWHRS